VQPDLRHDPSRLGNPDPGCSPDEARTAGTTTRRFLTTADSVRLSSRSWRREQPAAAVVLVHGFTSSADHPSVVALAEALHARGLEVVSYDARGHGRSTGESTLGDLERHDVAIAVEMARERAERVVVVGASMGAIAALRYAVTDGDLAGTVIVSCPADWRLPRNAQGLAAAVMTRTAVGRAIARRLLHVRIAPEWGQPDPPVDLAARLRTPLAIVHGDADSFIPVSDARALQGRAMTSTRLRVVSDMGHAFQPASIGEVVDSVGWILGEAPLTA
jgi:alpha-beta hydrolase superfamily lysophospholipase